ncbi:MAG: hypothetical protein AVDCRST_MAG77-4716 [uncultured Chloroflexi bacterium]|uniref:N-acetyltransferase domain-containing protein n=1 Tax=uncultured Chloroflexota bacterium TaxID=166587 RepID=A0A6J4JYM4_9CHLR|nr:MAG: hypothetical protein AVDCRST_MAG77-4716 [uncultured Chloroflexota bacterium]
MDGSVSAPPEFDWRPLVADDAPALRRLVAECDRAPNAEGAYAYTLPSLERVLASDGESMAARDSLCAVDGHGRVAAAAWARVPPGVRHEYRGLLLGAVHPRNRCRGLGSFLLQWAERRARALLTALPDDRHKILRIEFPGSRDDAVPLYGRRGFSLHHTEIEMERDLRAPIPQAPLPRDLELVEWAPEWEQAFYETWADAFSDRPGRAAWTRGEWVAGFGGGSAFRPDLSWLALHRIQGDAAARVPGPLRTRTSVATAGYVLCDVRELRPTTVSPVRARSGEAVQRVGGIRQVGVRPAWRGRGVATALLCAAMRAFRAEGIERAMLEVNANNSAARRLYERLGFIAGSRFTVFTKPAPALGAPGS